MAKKVLSIFFSCFFPLVSVWGQKIMVVPYAIKNINYKDKIDRSDFVLKQTKEKKVCKKFVDIELLKQRKYYAKHYIINERAICLENVFIPKKNKIKFNFGNLEVERDGEVIRETSKYIKIKNLDGTIDKIYKDGTNR